MLNGIDISSNNQLNGRYLDVSAVSTDFVIIKAMEGTSYQNPAMAQNVKQALAAKHLFGLYHYLRNNDPLKEAAWFLATVGPWVGSAVLALDVEDAPLLSQHGVDNALAFLQAVQKQTGVRPLLYTNQSEEHARNWQAVAAQFPLWLAQYNNYNTVAGFKPRTPPATTHWAKPTVFQYTASGRLPGWSGNLDFNVFAGDATAWRQLAAGTAPAAQPTATAPASAARAVQHYLNGTYNAKLAEDGVFGQKSHQAQIKAVQTELNRQGIKLAVDGVFGPKTQAAFAPLRRGSRGNLVRLSQGALWVAGFDPKGQDGVFGENTDAAARRFQAANKLSVDGVIGPMTAKALF